MAQWVYLGTQVFPPPCKCACLQDDITLTIKRTMYKTNYKISQCYVGIICKQYIQKFDLGVKIVWIIFGIVKLLVIFVYAQSG